MTQTTKIKIAVFFTYGVSLELWEKRGILSREVRFYEELATRVGEVWFFTYGRNDAQYTNRLGSHIKVSPKRLPVSNLLYGLLLPFLYWRALAHADFIRIHQVAGAIPALLTHWFLHKPLIVRAGYQWSLFHRQESTFFFKWLVVALIETLVYRTAQVVIVTTLAAKDYVVQRHRIAQQKIHVIPNWVDTKRFRPLVDVKSEHGSVCFVGRLSPEKNLVTLIESLQGTNVHLILYGDGPLRTALEQQTQRLGIHASFHGNLPNEQLPESLNACELFILPSLHEGNPKVLLEAMACELPCIGTNVEGINSLIEHEQNGILCGTDADSIRKAIQQLLSDPEKQTRLGKAARQMILETSSLSRAIDSEVALYQTI